MNKILFFSLAVYTSTLLSGYELVCRNPDVHVVADKAQKSTYKDCKRNGMTWWYRDNGKIKSEVNFVDDKEEGLYTSYYDNGTVRLRVNYVHGQKDGIQKIFYDNGQLGSQVNYNMGKREGVMREWDLEGYKSSEVFYKNNYKVGLKKYFDHSGNITQTETYNMDRNPVIQRILKDKEKEIKVDLAKYGLAPKDAKKEDRFK